MSDVWNNPHMQDALDRMKRAHDRQTGCHLTADMIEGLGLTFLAELWEQARPEEDDDTSQEPRP